MEERQEWVIITDPFNGSLLSYIKKDGTVAHTNGDNFEEYKKKYGYEVQLVPWIEFEEMRLNYHSKPFAAIEKFQFEGISPELRQKDHIIRNRYHIFYYGQISELIFGLYVHDIHRDNYYKGIKSLLMGDFEINREIIKDASAIINKK